MTANQNAIDRVEAKFGIAIIDPRRMNCLDGCRCMRCWHLMADQLITKGTINEEGMAV